MAGQTLLNVQANLSTDALFRTWGSGISAGVSAAGCVQTADTGQINWTTVSRAVAVTAAGYEIWRFNDALQSSAPVFIKIEYGSGSSTATPQIWLTVGTGSDGAGTITGTNIAGVSGASTTRTTVCSTNAQPGTGTGSTYVYGDGSTLASVQWPSFGASWGGGMFLIERWRNWDGTASGDGVSVLMAFGDSSVGGSVTVQQVCYLPGLAQNPGSKQTGVAGFYPQFGLLLATMVINGTVYPQPIFHGCGPRALGPSQYLLWTALGDYPLSSVSLTHYGTARSFLALGIGASAKPGWGAGLTAAISLVVRVD